ncbi:hypothetical protein [Prosthecobacter sp.]|uniref:hypothetical protein n=1 Tax=Prosthecobacter sp. TaxID=1965333 RepID=UPI001DC47D3F|nr:hypothetical protein [Prosthecobacter sp.]MCB1279492.1 hypothetical protein [Prosthecobacter sp.]
MKTILLSVIALQFGFVAGAYASELTTIETAQGKVYQQCKILKRDPDGVSFTHSKGTAKVLFTDLSESQRNILGYDAQKADAYEKERADARKEAEEARRARETKIAEAMIAARARYAAQQPIVLMQQPFGGFTSLAPVLGLGQIGVPNSHYHPGYYGHGFRQNRSWVGTGIASIGAGTGGIYVPQSGGAVINGFPGVSYSPTLGYTNTLNYNPAVPGFFGGQHSGVVPGVAVHGSASFPVHH